MRNFYEKVNFKAVIIFLLFYIIMFFVINISSLGVPKLLQITSGTNILDFEFGYTAEKAYATFRDMGSNGRAFYLNQIITIDYFFAMSYMIFYFSVIAFSFKTQIIKGNILNKLLLLPIFAMLFDWAENIVIAVMLSNYPNRLVTVCKIGSAFTIIKFIFIVLSVTLTVSLLFSLFLRFILKWRNIRKPTKK